MGSLAITNASAFFVPRWSRNRWVVLIAVSAALYCGPNMLLTLAVPDAALLLCSRVSIAAAAVHVLGWIRYAEADVPPLPARVRRAISAALLAGGVLFAVPGVGLTGRIATHPADALGLVYRVAEPTLAGAAIFALLVTGLLFTFARYCAGALRGVPYAKTHALALAVLLAAGVTDSAATLGLTRLPYLLDLAFFTAMAMVGVVMTRRWADDVRALDRAVRVRDEFITIASHELRTPISPLMLVLDLARRRIAQGRTEEVAPHLERARRQVDRLARLVNELLELTRIEAGRLRLEREPLELGAVLRDVVDRTADPRLSLAIEGSIEGEWDRLRVEQVLVNLIDNALKYGDGKPVVVRARADDGVAVVEVEDQGIGIAAEDQPRIFCRFERAAGGRSFGGFGLGLYITRQIVEAFGGTIVVRSEPHKGSTFTVALPRRSGTA